MTEVIWRAHPVYVNYQASSDGQVRNGRTGHVLRPSVRRKDDQRYLHVIVQGVTIRVHVFVCETFHGLKPAADLEVRHLNDLPRDNRPENLAWGTHTQNVDDMRHNRYRGPRETYLRFMAGETVTWGEALNDGSEWIAVPIDPRHMRKLRQMLSPPAGLSSGRQLSGIASRRTI